MVVEVVGEAEGPAEETRLQTKIIQTRQLSPIQDKSRTRKGLSIRIYLLVQLGPVLSIGEKDEELHTVVIPSSVNGCQL